MIELMANFRFDHRNYGVQAEHRQVLHLDDLSYYILQIIGGYFPKHTCSHCRALEAHPTINDELPYRIMTGTVQVRPEIATVAEDGVLFADATLVNERVVFCYGEAEMLEIYWKRNRCYGKGNARKLGEENFLMNIYFCNKFKISET